MRDLGHFILDILMLFISESMQKMRRTFISKALRSDKIFNVCQQVLLKTGEKEGLGRGDTSLANKCKCREDICYLIL